MSDNTYTEQIQDMAAQAKDSVANLVGMGNNETKEQSDAKDAANDLKEGANKAGKALDNKVEEAEANAKDAKEDLKDQTTKAGDAVGDKLQEAGGKVKENAGSGPTLTEQATKAASDAAKAVGDGAAALQDKATEATDKQ